MKQKIAKRVEEVHKRRNSKRTLLLPLKKLVEKNKVMMEAVHMRKPTLQEPRVPRSLEVPTDTESVVSQLSTPAFNIEGSSSWSSQHIKHKKYKLSNVNLGAHSRHWSSKNLRNPDDNTEATNERKRKPSSNSTRVEKKSKLDMTENANWLENSLDLSDESSDGRSFAKPLKKNKN